MATYDATLCCPVSTGNHTHTAPALLPAPAQTPDWLSGTERALLHRACFSGLSSMPLKASTLLK